MSNWPGNPRKERTTFGGLLRGQLMSRVRSAGNKTTEVRFCALLREARLTGWRRNRVLPGRPDFVWPKARVAVFVDGCFWHGHACGKNIVPKTNARAWDNKIRRNKNRDRRVTRFLRCEGWYVLRVWECDLKRPTICIRRLQRLLDRAVANIP